MMCKVSTKCVWYLFIKQSFHGIMGGECCPVQRDLTVSSSTNLPEQRERLQSKAIYSRPWITWGSSGFACNQLQMNRCHVALSYFCTLTGQHTQDPHPSIASLSFSWYILKWCRKEIKTQFYFSNLIYFQVKLIFRHWLHHEKWAFILLRNMWQHLKLKVISEMEQIIKFCQRIMKTENNVHRWTDNNHTRNTLRNK